jgi:hypothetical protein
MATIIPFLPSNLFAPKFRATFDGNDYEVTITWNISAQRYYVNVYGLDGSWIITVPLIQTPPARAVQSVAYDGLRQVVIVTMFNPTQWPIPLSPAGTNTPVGWMIDFTLENFDPPVFNGKWRSLHINDTTFSFTMTSDPGPALILGSVSRLLNMVAGVFGISTLIYRNGAFEVNP